MIWLYLIGAVVWAYFLRLVFFTDWLDSDRRWPW